MIACLNLNLYTCLGDGVSTSTHNWDKISNGDRTTQTMRQPGPKTTRPQYRDWVMVDFYYVHDKSI